MTRAACAALETAGISCWVAPRDILPSQTWSGAIVDAIAACRILVVVLSKASNASPEVAREVELASRRRRPILTWRIDNVTPSGPLEFFLSATQWQDALTRPLAPHVAELVATAGDILGRPAPEPALAQTTRTGVREIDPDDWGGGGVFGRLLRDR